MANVLHSQAAGIHPGAFVQDVAPDTSTIQNHTLWVDTSVSDGGGGGVTWYHAGSRTSVVHNPDPTSNTVVDGLSVDFTLAADATVRIMVSAITFKNDSSAGDRMAVRDNGALLTPSPAGGGTAGRALMPQFKPTSESTSNQQMCFMLVAALAAGAHTVDVVWQASGSTASLTWLDRYLTVEVLP